MQHLELNFVWKGTKAGLLCGLLAAANPASAGTMAHANPPDPLLDGGPTTACATGVDYAAGSDVNGQPVAPADVAAAPVPVPPAIAVPLHRGRANPRTGATDTPYVSLDGQKLDRLVNPPPCLPRAR